MLSGLRSLFSAAPSTAIDLSVVVVAYDMARELPRTLQSLSRSYQRDISHLNYEVIVVDNGSPQAVSAETVSEHGPEFRLLRIDAASASPGPAINRGVALARGKCLGIIIDGARVLSPGVLHWADQALRLNCGAVVAALGFDLGPEHPRLSSHRGSTREIVDQLLPQIAGRDDGYRVFGIASLAGSARFGLHGPLAECNCLFVSRALFALSGGYEEGFTSAGGGLINLEFYQRLCAAAGYQVYHLAGEGCFHQIHGGVTTGGSQAETRKFEDLLAEYQSVTGRKFKHLDYRPILLGNVPDAAKPLIARGLEEMLRDCSLTDRHHQHMSRAGLDYPIVDKAG